MTESDQTAGVPGCSPTRCAAKRFVFRRRFLRRDQRSKDMPVAGNLLLTPWLEYQPGLPRYHVKEISATSELTPAASLRKIRRVQIEGKRRISREISFYCLDVLISVGYRVNSSQATQFRIWATQALRNFVGTGFEFDYELRLLTERFGKDCVGKPQKLVRRRATGRRPTKMQLAAVPGPRRIDDNLEAIFTSSTPESLQHEPSNSGLESVPRKRGRELRLPTPFRWRTSPGLNYRGALWN